MTNFKNPACDKESFHEWIMSCCDTLIREEDKIFNMTKDKTRFIDITFPLRVGETPTMLIQIEKIVQNSEDKIFIIKNLEDREIDRYENKDDNE